MDGQTQQPETNVTVDKVAIEFHAPDAVGTPAPAKPSLEQLIDEWFRQHFHGRGGALPEHVYNWLHLAKEDLKRLLAAL